jgi:RHS repeat-associated protein
MPMKVRYTTVNGAILAEKRDGVRRSYVPDPLGSTVALLDNTQTKTDTFQYWPYGEERSRTGTTPTPFRFGGTRGYYRDAGSRVYVRRRVYGPTFGRWLTADPLAPRQPRYQYARSAPTVRVDPSGLICWDCSTFPGGPCAYWKFLGLATPEEGGTIICCKGKKWPCVWKNDNVCISQCLQQHEDAHARDTLTKCPPGFFGKPSGAPFFPLLASECEAHLIELECLLACCPDLVGADRAACEDWFCGGCNEGGFDCKAAGIPFPYRAECLEKCPGRFRF